MICLSSTTVVFSADQVVEQIYCLLTNHNLSELKSGHLSLSIDSSPIKVLHQGVGNPPLQYAPGAVAHIRPINKPQPVYLKQNLKRKQIVNKTLFYISTV